LNNDAAAADDDDYDDNNSVGKHAELSNVKTGSNNYHCTSKVNRLSLQQALSLLLVRLGFCLLVFKRTATRVPSWSASFLHL
jgi:hypothetical protein